MFDEAEFVRLATSERGKLCTVAIKYLNKAFRDDLNDVVQHALCETWERRSSVRFSTRHFLYTVTMRTAIRWRASERKHSVQLSEHFDIPEPCNPEEALLLAEQERASHAEWSRLRARLDVTSRRHLKDWESRGYLNHTHGHECATTRVRAELGRLNRRRIPATHLSDYRVRAKQAQR